jgi:hypothetical protein
MGTLSTAKNYFAKPSTGEDPEAGRGKGGKPKIKSTSIEEIYAGNANENAQ